MRCVVSKIKKTFMHFDWGSEYEEDWLKAMTTAASAKDLYEAGTMVEEFGVDWVKLRGADGLLKMLESIHDDWLDTEALHFVRQVLPKNVGGWYRGVFANASSLAPITALQVNPSIQRP